MLDARPSVLCLALLLLACDSGAGGRGTVDLSRGADPSSADDPSKNAADSSTATPHDTARCEAIVEAANALLESHRTCQVDADCRDEAVPAPCPAATQCAVFVRKDTDGLWSESLKLERDYKSSCRQCPLAKCSARETTRAYCDATQHCAGRKLPVAGASDASTPSSPVVGTDASTPASADASTPAGTDAGSKAPGTPSQTDAGSSSSPYACKVNLDCVVTNVGNCCGYYPRCANANATFAPPVCSGGQAGVCGFPSIDSCECRKNECVSLQAGNPL